MTARLRSAPFAPRPRLATLLPVATAVLLSAGCGAPQPTPAPPSPALPGPATLHPGTTPGETLAPTISAPPAAEQPEPAPADPALAPLLQQVLDDWRAEEDAPGAVLGVRLADGRTAVVASGRTDDEGGQPVVPGHRFRIGSITKVFVATLVLQLVDEGLVELDEEVATYLPQAPFAENVTVRELLAHTSGIPDFGTLAEYHALLLREPAREWSATEVLDLVADRPLEFQPGSRTSYSNTNYVLAGMLAEEVTETALAELLRERIFRPAGLESTYLEGREPATEMAVSGHFDVDRDDERDNVRGIPYTALVTSGAAAGGLSASALDVLDFAEALFTADLISRAALDEMTDMGDDGYGLGLGRMRRDGELALGHDGALPGFSAAFGYLPDAGITFVAMSNETGANVHALLERVLSEAVVAP